MHSHRRAVITGFGAFSGLGNSAAETWTNVMEKRLGYAAQPAEDSRIKAKFFGLVDAQAAAERSKRHPKALMRKLSSFAKYAVIAADEALEHAFPDGPVQAHYATQNCGVVIGTGWGGNDAANLNNNDYRATGYANPYSTIMAMNNLGTAALSILHKFGGYQSTPVAACASGAIAIGEAAGAIQSGRADFMLAGGSESLREVFNVWSIDVLEALSKEQDDIRKACCPFSLDRSGFVLSEGAAVVCIEEYEAARRRGARIYGEILGYGNSSDAHDFTAPAPDAAGRTNVIRQALEFAEKRPEDVHYVNAHGTSTQLNDYRESEAIKAVFGDHAPRTPISSTKSYSGHLIGAAGALETVFCLKALETRIAPATLHLDRPDPRCDLDYVPNEHRRLEQLDVCLNLSFGFGGANASLLLGRV